MAKKEKMVTVTIKNGAEFTVELTESKIAEIFGKNYGKVELSTLKAGEIFSTGKYEWVVLEQSGDTTAVLLKDVLQDKKQFDNSSNDWNRSTLRKWLNNTFANELSNEIGEDNLVEHTPDLSTDDGTSKYTSDGTKDKVSLLSCNSYRAYRQYIPKVDDWYWTLTPYSSEVYTSFVRFVYSDGSLFRNYCSYGVGVRPFCIFKSKILISKGE